MASVDSDKIEKKKALGRGLASLIPSAKPEGGAPAKKDYFLCGIEKIVPNTYQPRKIFDKDALAELVESIKSHGIIQPLVVQRRDGHYEIIAGERRWRAAQKAGLKEVPVVVKELPGGDRDSLELAIIENVQRENLNSIEEAIAYQQLVDEFQLSQEEIAQRVGKSRASVANIIRLLKLPAVIREDISSNKLTMGHARALLGLESTEDQLKVREMILKKKLSVRETERRVNEVLKGAPAESSEASGEEKSNNKEGALDANLQALEDDLRRQFATSVKILGNDTKGQIQFAYASREDLMQLADKLKGDHVSS